MDYSFIEGKLIPSVEFYYNERGATNTNQYLNLADIDGYLRGKYYLYCNLTYAKDEFLNFGAYAFANLADGSGMVIPFLNYQIFDGLTLSTMFAWVWGEGNEEFSKDTIGEYSLLLRAEAKL